MQGTIHRVIRGKGFGFIRTEECQYFFHHSEVQNAPFKRLAPGDLVEFQAHEESEGLNPRATDVLVVTKVDRRPRRSGEKTTPSPRPSGGPGESRRTSPPMDERIPSSSPSEPNVRSQDPDDFEFVSGFGSSTEGEATPRRRRRGPGPGRASRGPR